MPNINRVLITGAGGTVARALINELGGKYELVGQDKREDQPPPIPTTKADLSDYSRMRPAFDDIDAVIHLGADPSTSAPWSSILPNNLIATRNVYEACREAGVGRVVFASSNHAVGMFELDEPYRRIRVGDYTGLEPGKFPQVDHTVPIRPDSDYGVSKAFGEAYGRYYWENFGVEAACLRIGAVNRENRPLNVRMLATWLSYRDLAQLVDRCLQKDGLGFDIFYGVSNNTWRFWDIEHARETLGYNPQDNGEEYRKQVE